MLILQQFRVRSQHLPTQWNLRGGRWNSVEYNTEKEKLPKNLPFFYFSLAPITSLALTTSLTLAVMFFKRFTACSFTFSLRCISSLESFLVIFSSVLWRSTRLLLSGVGGCLCFRAGCCFHPTLCCPDRTSDPLFPFLEETLMLVAVFLLFLSLLPELLLPDPLLVLLLPLLELLRLLLLLLQLVVLLLLSLLSLLHFFPPLSCLMSDRDKQGFGSVYIIYGSGSSILKLFWIRIRILDPDPDFQCYFLQYILFLFFKTIFLVFKPSLTDKKLVFFSSEKILV